MHIWFQKMIKRILVAEASRMYVSYVLAHPGGVWELMVAAVMIAWITSLLSRGPVSARLENMQIGIFYKHLQAWKM